MRLSHFITLQVDVGKGGRKGPVALMSADEGINHELLLTAPASSLFSHDVLVLVRSGLRKRARVL